MDLTYFCTFNTVLLINNMYLAFKFQLFKTDLKLLFRVILLKTEQIVLLYTSMISPITVMQFYS